MIYNRNRISQIKNYNNLRWNLKGGLSPTDIDGYLELNDKLFIFFELKYKNIQLSRGQELALERLVDVVSDSKRTGYLFIASHTTENTSEDIDVGKCIVERYRYNKKWITSCNLSLYDSISFLINKYVKK